MASAGDSARALKGSIKEHTEAHRADDRDLDGSRGNTRKDRVEFQETSRARSAGGKKEPVEGSQLKKC